MDIRMHVTKMARDARNAGDRLARIPSPVKDLALWEMAQALLDRADYLLTENAKDLECARGQELSAAMVDRLTLKEVTIRDIAEGLREVAALPDPVGKVDSMWRRPNGLLVGRMRIPLGVIGIIYESRPNVTADAAAICLKSGNAVILRGGSEAIHSNVAIAQVLRDVLKNSVIPEAAIRSIPFVDREGVNTMLELEEYIDLIIPRGGGSSSGPSSGSPGFP